MTSVKVRGTRGQAVHRRRVDGRRRRRHVRGSRPVHGRRRRPRRPPAPATMRSARSRPPPQAFPAWSQSAAGRSARRSSSRPPTSSSRAGTRSSACSRARPAPASASACSRWASCPGLLRQAAAAAYSPLGQILPSDHPGTLAMGIRKPVGVVGAIAPWNAALILSARSIAAPLALGNTVVLKPSELVADRRRTDLGRDLRRGRPARRRAEHRHARARRRRRRSATSWSRTRPCAGSTSPARRRPGAGSPRRPGASSSASCSSSAATTR